LFLHFKCISIPCHKINQKISSFDFKNTPIKTQTHATTMDETSELADWVERLRALKDPEVIEEEDAERNKSQLTRETIIKDQKERIKKDDKYLKGDEARGLFVCLFVFSFVFSLKNPLLFFSWNYFFGRN